MRSHKHLMLGTWTVQAKSCDVRSRIKTQSLPAAVFWCVFFFLIPSWSLKRKRFMLCVFLGTKGS